MNEELQEQLAEVRTERDQLESEKDDLEEQLSEKDETISNKDEKIEQLSDEIEDLEEEIGPFQEMLAEIVAEDSMLDAESVSERYEISEMTEMLAATQEDEDEDVSPVDVVKEQLGESPTPRGEGPSEDEPGNITPEQLAEANDLARSVMSLGDVKQADKEQLSPREYVKEHKGVDPVNADNEAQLKARIDSGGE